MWDLATVLEAAPDAMVAVARDGRIRQVNRLAEELFGYSRLELVGQCLEVLVPPNVRARHRQFRGAFARDAHARSMGAGREFLALRKNGELVPVDISLSHLGTREDGVVLAAVRDMTEHHRIADRLNEAKRSEAVGRLAGGIAHEFNNLLTVVRGSAGLLRSTLEGAAGGEPEDDASPLELVELIDRAGRRAATLVQQLLAFGRRQLLSPRRVVVDETLETFTEAIDALASDRIEVRWDLQAQGAVIVIDPIKLHQIVLTLALWAKQAMHGGGWIGIRTRATHLAPRPASDLGLDRAGDHVVIEFEYAGPGLASVAIDRVFEPFSHVEGEEPGLQLASVQGTVTQSGGSIVAHAQRGGGSRFALYFPLATD